MLSLILSETKDLLLEKTMKNNRTTNMRNLKIFVSSTWQDLREEREAIKESLSRMNLSFVGMEFFWK